MGRELGIHRIDFLEDGTAIIRHSDYNLCGRTDFTGDITNLFYHHDKELCYLIVKPESGKNYFIDEIKTIHVKVEDPYWDSNEFDMDYGFVYRYVIQEIVDENIEKDNHELEREHKMLADARVARRRAANVEIFNDFSTLIDDLQEHIYDYNEEAKGYITEIKRIEETLHLINDSSEEPSVVESYILLTYSE